MRITAILPLLLTPAAALAGSYQTSLERLGVTDPEFVVHVNVDDDFASLGNFLSEAYIAYLATSPDALPVPVDFRKVFERLGLESLASVTLVSEASPRGGFINQGLFLFEGAPQGLFTLTGTVNRPFTIASQAPADAAFVAEFNIDGPALLGIFRNIALDMMGPLGQGLMDAQLLQPLNEDGLTLQDVFNRLRTNVQVMLKPEPAALPPDAPAALALLTGKAAVRVANLADLLPVLAPQLQAAGFTQEPVAGGTAWKLALPGDSGVSVLIQQAAETNDLLVCLSEASATWLHDKASSISTSPDFLAAINGLPGAGLSFWYADAGISSLQIQGMDADLKDNPKAAPLLASLKKFLLRYTGPQAGVTFLEDDAYRIMSWQPVSHKTSIGIAAIAVPIGIAASIQQADAGDAQTSDAPAEAEDTAPQDPTGAPVE